MVFVKVLPTLLSCAGLFFTLISPDIFIFDSLAYLAYYAGIPSQS